MKNKRKSFITKTIVVAIFVIIASVIRHIPCDNDFYRNILFVVTFTIYVVLIASWAVSIQRRIMHRKVRHYLIGIAVFLLLFAFIRTVKFSIGSVEETFNRLMWYAYYIPQLFCPLFSYRAARSISLPEKEDISIKERLLTLIPTILLALLVITNDFHGLVFAGEKYSYSIGYYLTAGWILLLAILSIRQIRIYSRTIGLNRQRKYAYIVLAAGVIWCLLYAINNDFWGYIEYFAIFSIIVISLWEVMIQIGMIPSNSAYEWCYANSSIRAQILDREGKTIYRSAQSEYQIDRDFFEASKDLDKVLINADTQMKASKLRGGYVFWERDISQINVFLDELKEIKEEIVDASETLRNNIAIAARKHSLKEQNRLYDLIIKNTDLQIALIERYLELCEICDSDADFKKLIRSINVFGSYVKRKSNIVLVSNEEGAKLGQELQLAYREIMSNIEKTGVKASYMFRGNTEPTIDICLVLMDFFENVVEIVLPLVKDITVIVAGNDGNATQTISFTLRENIVLKENVFKASFDMWNKLLDENYLGSFNVEAEGDEYVLCMSISSGKAVEQ